jgi:SAM-dependent methyltransferase
MTGLYAPFLSHVPDGGRILDAGCGSGRDTKYFLEHGYDVDAFDASPAMAHLASEYLGRGVRCMTFDDVDLVDELDGVWACSSLLHVPARKMQVTVARLAAALKPQGILYASFKYGAGEWERGGRRFTSYDEDAFTLLVDAIPDFALASLWRSQDSRPGHPETWLNALLLRL